MPIGIRRAIYVSFIVLFLIVAPLIALYSMGYRYHWGKRAFERTGLIILDGAPRDASVAIDGALRATHLPARIGGLGPNAYTVRVARTGFHTWERRVVVERGQTTFLTNTLLFRDAQPERIVAGAIATVSVSADGQWLATLRTFEGFEELWLHNLTSGERTLVLRTLQRPDTASALTWSPQGARLLVTTPTDVLLIEPSAPSPPRSIRAMLDHAPTLVQWELGSDDAVTAVLEGRIVRIHLATSRAVALPIPIPEYPFAVGRTALYTSQPYHDPQGQDTEVLAISTDGGASRQVATISGPPLARFLDLRGTTLIAEQRVDDTHTRTLTMRTTGAAPMVRDGYGITRHPHDTDAILWRSSSNELWAERGADAPPQLLLRHQAPLRDALWHPSAPFILFATEQSVSVVEVDAPSPRSAKTLATFDAVSHIAVTPNGATLLIAGRRGEDAGLWSLPLQ